MFHVFFTLRTGAITFAGVRLNNAFFERCGLSLVDAANATSCLIERLCVLHAYGSCARMLVHWYCISSLFRRFQEALFLAAGLHADNFWET
jgi:hypothetical protein